MKKRSAISRQQLARHALCLFVFVSSCYALIFLPACIPARVPDNLDDTPGPPVVVTDRTFESSRFIARYPQGWRIVTGEAQAPPAVIFVAPDEATTIRLMVGPLDNANLSADGFQTEVRGLTLTGGLEMTAILSAPVGEWETYLPVFERVLASLRPA